MDQDATLNIAKKADALPNTKKSTIQLRQPCAPSETAKEEAREILAAQLLGQSKYKDPRNKWTRRFKSEKRVEKTLDEDIRKFCSTKQTSVVENAVANNQSVDIVAALFQYEPLVNLNTVLVGATSAWNCDMVCLVLHHRGSHDIQPALDVSLNDVVLKDVLDTNSTRDKAQTLDLLSTLQAAGAITRLDCFKSAVSQQQEAAVEILLRGKKTLQPAVLSDALISAAKANNYNLVSMLLAYGADPDMGSVICLKEAVAHQNFRIAAALLTQPRDGAIATSKLNSCLRDMLDFVATEEQLEWLELFLLAGADSNLRELASRLLHAVQSNEQEVVRLLVSHGTPVARPPHNALELAIAKADKVMIQALTAKKGDPASMGDLMPTLGSYFTNRQDQRQVTQWLLGAGAAGDGLHTSVVWDIAKSRGREALLNEEGLHVQLLLDGGASVDYNDGLVLEHAFASQNLDLLELLCHPRPNQHTLSAVLALVHGEGSQLDHATTVSAVKVVLKCNPDKPALLGLLLRMIRQQPNAQDLIRLLLEHKAIDRDDDDTVIERVLREANERCDVETFKTIASHVPDRNKLEPFFYKALPDLEKARVIHNICRLQTKLDESVVTEAKNTHSRYGIIEFLLELGASADQALIVIALEKSLDGALCKLLLHHGASVDFREGEAIKLIIGQHNLETLRELMRKPPSARTIDGAFSYARTCLKDDNSRHEIYGILLSARSVVPTELNDALLDLARTRSQHADLWKLLLKRGASPNYQDGAAIVLTIQQRDPTFLRMLLSKKAKLETSALNNGLLAGMKLDQEMREWRVQVAELLLNAGARGTVVDNALNQAVRDRDSALTQCLLDHCDALGLKAAESVIFAAISGDPALLERLLKKSDHTIATKAIEAMTTSPFAKKLDSASECLCLLLVKKPGQRCLDRALASYIEASLPFHYDELFVSVLLDNHANVNAFDGSCFLTAARQNRPALFCKLMSYAATSETLTRALPLFFGSGISEDKLVEIFGLCFLRAMKPYTNETGTPDPLTYLSLVHYPTGKDILQSLLSFGYTLDWHRQVTVKPELGVEEGGALLYLLATPGMPTVSEDVLNLMLRGQGTISE